MTNIVVGYPMVNAGSLYLNGLNLSATSTTVLTVSPGAARDNTNQDDIVLPAAATVTTTVSGIGGLDTGTIAATTFYAVYLIGSSLSANPEINEATQVSTMASGTTILNGTVIAEGTVAQPTWSVQNNPQPGVMISLSATQPTLPEGYDMFRRIGFVKTDGASHFLPFWQDGVNTSTRTMWYDAPISVLTATASATFEAQSLAVAVPVGVGQTRVILQADLDPNAAANFVELRPTGSSSTNGNVKMSGDVAGVHHFDQLQAIAAVSAGALSIDWMTDAASTVALAVSAYVDQL
jgi:hypothetical protein